MCELLRTALLPCVVALLAAGSAAGEGAAQGAAPDLTAAKSVTFEDAAAEDPQGPDITTVTVSNDDTGLISFRVAIPSRPTLAEGMRFRIWIDSDSNPATGLAANGMDYYLFHDAGRTSLYRCGGTVCTNAARATTLEFSYAGGPRFAILDAEIGNAKRFRFAVEAATGIFVDPATKTVHADDARFDDAPARGSFWTYRLAIGPQRLLVKSLATSPARAGTPLTVRALATRADTGAALSSGRVRCAARIAARRVEVRSQGFVGTRAVCVFGIPADAAGETIRGSVTVTFGGKKVTRAFSARVRS